MNPSTEDIARIHRLHSLADMAGGMAHEFNQPLTVIRGSAENLLIARQRGWQLTPERIDDKLATIVAQCDRISGLIDEVRRFARGAEDLSPAPLLPADAIEDALRLGRVQLSARGIGVSVEDRSGGRLAHVDRHALADVIIELLRNAREAIVGSSRCHGTIIIAIETADAAVVVRVTDEGPGMDPAAAQAAIKPFDPRSGAASLGLAIARRTIETMGGSLAIDSQPGRGTTVILTLPAVADASASG